MKTLMICIGLAIGAVLMAGCEWTTGGNADSWNTSQFTTNMVDFSGSYKAADGGILVKGFSSTSNSVSTNQVVGELLGVGDGSATAFSGVLAHEPARGSLTIAVGAYRFTDSGSGSNAAGTVSLAVTPADGSTGTINFGTHAWSLVFPAPIAAGSAILAGYFYYEASSSSSQGNSGRPIYSFIVYQIGNRLQLIDNNNNSYVGELGVVTPGAGTPHQFSATGVSQGYKVTMVGVFQRSGTARTLTATFIEEGGKQGDIQSTAQ